MSAHPSDGHLHLASMDRHDLYELCVQSPRDLVPLLRAVHGGREARILCEDFCGTAALSRAWCEMVESGSAIATDVSDEVLARAARNAPAGLTLARGDATHAEARGDIIFVGNFSIGEIHERAALVRYLTRCRERLNADGVFVCDTYGGESAFRVGHVQRLHPLAARDPGARVSARAGGRVRYTWEQREADPLTGMVVNAMHFRIERGGVIEDEIRDAFVYRWRLWSVPELRDALREAGFVRTDVYGKMPDAVDGDGRAYVLAMEEVEDGEGFIVCVCGRV